MTSSTTKLMSGNEAIARGAYEAGVIVGTAYPGTPSTEILEQLSRFPGLRAHWAPNEKVALEVGIGASLAGARVLVAMKHVGVNVAADPLMTLSYTGVGGGLLLVSADDPGMHSSQNEQDNRHYARLAKIPLLEPSDSQEARDFVIAGLELSERFDTPVLLRTTTRISHSRSLVKTGVRNEIDRKGFQKDPAKYVMIPGYARRRRPLVEKRLAGLRREAERSPLNRTEGEGTARGFICSGITYQYVKEALPGERILKLGFSYPLPEKMIRDFAATVKEIIVVEELDPFRGADPGAAAWCAGNRKTAFPRNRRAQRESDPAGHRRRGQCRLWRPPKQQNSPPARRSSAPAALTVASSTCCAN